MNDHAARQRALQANQSFIVQAPAGSGKTELLIQRCLVLLSQVAQPESVLALTFTRKAATEMRERLLQALQRGQDDTPPGSDHARVTWQLARQVLKHDQQHDWQLCNNPQRLRITTIDSLCAGLIKHMPLLSGMGSLAQVTEMPDALYQAAVQSLLDDLQDDQVPWHQALMTLMHHCDNRVDLVTHLLTQMLSRREQWLPMLVQAAKHTESLKHHIEAALNALQEATLQGLQDSGAAYLSAWCEIVRFSHERLGIETARPYTMAWWQQLTKVILAKDGWRQRYTEKEGFPAASKEKDAQRKAYYQAAKAHVSEVVGQCQSNNALLQLLMTVRDFPPVTLNQTQWQAIDALLGVLPVLVAHLTVVMAQRSQVDFNALSLAALQALGEPQAPTDLALYMDLRIEHILVDEFQDTSSMQYRLLERLTAGWQSGDGRTLFCVGDPMQSIYRFRQADVGLFLQAKQEGIGDVALEFICLTRNFRSSGVLVEWFNQTFADVLPQHDDALTGSVSYSQAQAVHQAEASDGVQSLLFDQAAGVPWVEVIRSAQHTSGSIALIVRSRPHLDTVLPALQRAAIHYQAVDIETLSQRAMIQDLLSLTQALCDHTHRLAWLAILRAPWLGLSLPDLTRIAQASQEQTIWATLQEPSLLEQLSAYGCQVLPHFITCVHNAITQRDRGGLSVQIEALWQALQGPACLRHEQDNENARRYFALLEQYCECGRLQRPQQFLQQLQQLRAVSIAPQADAISVMTIHKSKGLEFDTVILPGLEHHERPADQPVLLWEDVHIAQQEYLLMAPIRRRDQTKDSLYQLLYQREQQRSRQETRRLLYVAATRAKRRLVLVGQVIPKDGEIKQSSVQNFLGMLWAHLPDRTVQQSNIVQEQVAPVRAGLERLTGLPTPSALLDMTWGGNYPQPWHVPEVAAAVGTVMHQLLAQWVGLSPEQVLAQWQRLRESVILQLVEQGVTLAQQAQAYSYLDQYVRHMTTDQHGQWLIQCHQMDCQEYPLHWLDECGEVNKVILDRSFVDKQGVRWIIDYKTAQPPAAAIEDWLAQQVVQYQGQLQRYREIWQRFESGEIRCALYFIAIPRLVNIL